MKQVRVHAYGGPEQMRVDELPTPEPGPGQARVQVAAAGVNFIDIYQRSGAYKAPLPLSLGREGAGTVDAVGAGVTTLQVGDRVAWADVQGSYADIVIAPVDKLVRLPDGMELQQAAAAMLQGMTAHYLVRTTFPLDPGERCLIHAAAGGVGQLLVQMAKHCGAFVIATCGSEEKAQIVRELGADAVINYRTQDFEAEVKRITDGKGVDVVYDSVGKDTFDKGLDCLQPLGYMVLFGQSSGPVAPVDPQTLNAKGSLFLTRPSLFAYVSKPEWLAYHANETLEWIRSGEVKLHIDEAYPLADAAKAHAALAGRQTTGKLLLIP